MIRRVGRIDIFIGLTARGGTRLDGIAASPLHKGLAYPDVMDLPSSTLPSRAGSNELLRPKYPSSNIFLTLSVSMTSRLTPSWPNSSHLISLNQLKERSAPL